MPEDRKINSKVDKKSLQESIKIKKGIVKNNQIVYKDESKNPRV